MSSYPSQTIVRVGYRIALTLGLIGFFFRIMHYPLSSLLIVSAGGIGVVVSGLSLVLNPPVTLLKLSKSALFAGIFIHFVFRSQHWPGLTYVLIGLIISGLCFLVFGGLPVALETRERELKERGWLTKTSRIATLALMGVQFLLTSNQLQGRNLALSLGVVTALIWIWSTVKPLDEDPKPSIGVLDETVEGDSEF